MILGCVRLLQQDLEKRRIRSKVRVSREGKRSGGQAFSRGALYTLLANPIYVGEVRHKTARYEGQHDAILDREPWQKVQQQLKDQGTARKGATGKSSVSPLAGKLYDDEGNKLVPSHTVKKGRRYRYYISQKLANGRAKDADGPWRLPAPEIETAVATEAAKILEEPAAIANLVSSPSSDRRRAQALIRRFKSYVEQLNDDDQQPAALAEIVQKVVIAEERISIELNVATLLPEGDPAEDRSVIHREVPLKLKRQGVETRLVIGGIERLSQGVDPALVKLLSRAVTWWESIETGESSIERIAKHERLSERYLRDILQLAFLAPEIVEGIVRGGQVEGIHWDALMCHPVLPLRWRQQVELFEV